MKYDPMTGEPISEEAVTPEVTPEVTPVNQAVESVKSMISSMSTKKWFLPALIGGGVGIVAVVAAVAVVVSGAFLSPAQKVAAAAANTFKEAGVMGDLLTSTLSASTSDKSTTRVMFGAEGVEVEMEYRYAKTGDKQIWMNADVPGYPEIEGTATLTKKELQLSAPLLGDYLYYYDYTADNDGVIFEQVDEELVETLNELLADAYSGKMAEESEALKEMVENIQDWMEELEIEEADKEEFEINGKDVNCAGYEIVIDEETILEYVEIVCDGMVDYMKEQGLDEVEGFDSSMYDDLYEEVADEFEGMPEITVSVYMHSNMLAAIVFEGEEKGQEIEILFEGGDYRAQNITVKAANEKVLSIKGEKDGNEESLRLIVYVQDYYSDDVTAVTLFEYEYDKKSGDFEAKVFTTSGKTAVEIEGNIVCNGNGVEITDGSISAGDETIDFEFSCKKGAKIEKMSGERFDIGNADEDDLEDLVEDLQGELEDFLPSYDYDTSLDDYYGDWY